MTFAELWLQLRARLLPRRASHASARGAAAERAAARYLRRRGYRILARNLHVVGGEIDLLATHEDWLVVVEVRSYKSLEGRPPRATLSPDKQRRLHRLTQELHKRPRWRDRPVRLDLVEVQTDAHDRVVGFAILQGL